MLEPRRFSRRPMQLVREKCFTSPSCFRQAAAAAVHMWGAFARWGCFLTATSITGIWEKTTCTRTRPERPEVVSLFLLTHYTKNCTKYSQMVRLHHRALFSIVRYGSEGYMLYILPRITPLLYFGKYSGGIPYRIRPRGSAPGRVRAHFLLHAEPSFCRFSAA